MNNDITVRADPASMHTLAVTRGIHTAPSSLFISDSDSLDSHATRSQTVSAPQESPSESLEAGYNMPAAHTASARCEGASAGPHGTGHCGASPALTGPRLRGLVGEEVRDDGHVLEVVQPRVLRLRRCVRPLQPTAAAIRMGALGQHERTLQHGGVA
jgi:hypothetical protein